MLLILTICLTLTTMFYLLNKMESWENKNSSSFECGYTPLFSSRFSFSTPYFFITIIFLFLDLELCLILPLFIQSNKEWKNNYILILLMGMILISLILEWKTSELNWLK